MQSLQFHHVFELKLTPTQLIGSHDGYPGFATTDLIIRHNTLSGPVETRISFFADTSEQLLLAPQSWPADNGPQEEDDPWAERSGQLLLDLP